jgi:hypothetical protein
MEAQALVGELQVSPASLVCYSLRRLVPGCAKASFLISPHKIQTPTHQKALKCKIHLAGAPFAGHSSRQSSDQLTSCNQNYPL